MNKKRKVWKVFAREYIVSLFPVIQLVDSVAGGIKCVVGSSADAFACKLEDHAIWWLDSGDWNKLHSYLVKCVQNNLKWYCEILQDIEKRSVKLVDYSKKLSRLNLAKVSSPKLFSYYAKFIKLNSLVYDAGLICPLLDYQSSTYLTDELNRILRVKLPSSKVNEYFSILTTPLRKSPDRLQEESLRLLYLELKKIPQYKILLKLPFEKFIDSIKSVRPNWYKSFRAHVNKFKALPYVYEGPAADEEYFFCFIRDWAKYNFNPKLAFRKDFSQHHKLAILQICYLKELNLTSLEQLLAKAARDTTFIKPYRRLLQSQAYCYFEVVLSEVGRRLGLSLRQVRYLLPQELKMALVRGYADIEQLNQRIKCCIYIMQNGKRKILVGKEANRFWRQVYQEKVMGKIKNLSGTIACTGRASGKVCIVNTPEDMVNMKPGRILVSFATSPNLMPAIRQAKAIVTDEGGLTSHAAIVSRELNIPCVIGTKFATQIFKNGDKVVVDANRGVVTKK
jgi:phosphohistidine swiveling domain-containing protein